VVATAAETPAVPATPGDVAAVAADASTKCVVTPAPDKKKKSLKRTDNNRMEAESTDE
jgi:hypothetical protein